MIFSRIFLIAIFICGSAFADQVLEDLNADLLNKKKSLEPFDQSKVKIDVESLGLDDVDKKTNQGFAEKDLPNLTKTETKSSEEKNEQIPVNKVDVVKDKPQEKPIVDDKEEAVATTPVVKDQNEQNINTQKKRNLKKRLALEKKRKESAKKQEEKLKKFNELRNRYLSEIAEEEPDNAVISEEKIVPRKKDLNPFLNEDLPALPILNRYRTSENMHIPTILTFKERVDLLFNTISSNDVSAFIEAYGEVENPNVKNSLGDTILTYAILLRRYAIVAAVKRKGDVNMPNKLGYTPLNIALEMLDFKSFELLADNKADLNDLDNFGRSYLMQAARVGFLPAVDLLVSRGVDVNLMDHDGFTALAVAYRYKKEVIVQYLLKHGAKTWTEKPYDPKTQSLIQELESKWK